MPRKQAIDWTSGRIALPRSPLTYLDMIIPLSPDRMRRIATFPAGRR